MEQEKKRPLIFISNDDGYQAKGIKTLTDIAREFGDVVVVAPDGGRSGSALCVTFNNIITTTMISEEPGLTVYSCSGTPCDCTKMGITNICERTPDLVLSGINHGDNSSVNVHYSGTMGVVIEGCMKGIPSIGFSLCTHLIDADFDPMKPYIRKVIGTVLKEGLPKGVCLNVNAPDLKELRGLKVCAMGNGIWENEWEKRLSPRGFDYYWLVGSYNNIDPTDAETDCALLRKGYVTVTPTKIDITAYEAFDSLRESLEQA